MANPNINAATDIKGNNSLVNLTSTNTTLLVSNAANSGKVFLIDSIYVANVDGTNACDITIEIYPEDDNTGTATLLSSTISVPADATLIIVEKTANVTLKEDRSIYAKASAANDLHVTTSWKEIS